MEQLSYNLIKSIKLIIIISIIAFMISLVSIIFVIKQTIFQCSHLNPNHINLIFDRLFTFLFHFFKFQILLNIISKTF